MNGVSLFSISYQGLDGLGGCTAIGVKVGDRVLQHYRANGTVVFGQFEQTISVDDEVQQISEDDLSSSMMTAIILRVL